MVLIFQTLFFKYMLIHISTFDVFSRVSSNPYKSVLGKDMFTE